MSAVVKKIKYGKLLFRISVVLVLIAITTAFIANHYVKKHGYRNLWHFITVYSSNKSMSGNAKFETLEIKIDKADFNKLKAVREKALKRGVLIDEGDAFVDAKLKHNGKKIKAKLRLKGHMTDHLQDKKWSFRVKTKGGDAFMGMKIFSLQHPGTRNYIYEYIYHQMMKQEGIIALNYDFIKVKVNDEDWGIYALEEHFAQELVQRNKRPKGPILRFNPDMYWNYRIAELQKQLVDQTNADFQSANIEAYDDKTIYNDSSLLSLYQEGLQQLELFRRGKLSTSQAFDIKKLASFHAIIDLVGGHHSLDWSDVKYYYNGITHKLEPVAYESFSIRRTNTISGYNRFSTDTTYITNFHDKLFSDFDFFVEYMNALERIASKPWLDKFLKSNQKKIDKKLAVLYKDFAYKEYDTKPYYENIKLINRCLNHGAMLQAQVYKTQSNKLMFELGGIDGLPLKIIAVSVDSIKMPLNNSIIIPAKKPNSYTSFIQKEIDLKVPFKDSISATTKIKVHYTIPGLKQQQTVIAAPVGMADAINTSSYKFNPNLQEFARVNKFISVNNSSKTIIIEPGQHTINQWLIIPAGYTVIPRPGCVLNMTGGTGIVSHSPWMASGSPNNQYIKFTSSDSTGRGITILNCFKPSVFTHCIFSGMSAAKNVKGAALTLYASNAKLEHLLFENNTVYDVRLLNSTKTSFKDCVFSNNAQTSCHFSYSIVTMQTCFYNSCKEGVQCIGSNLALRNISFVKNKTALVAQKSSTVSAFSTSVVSAKIAFEAVDASVIRINEGSIADTELAFKAHKKGDVFGPSSIVVKKVKQTKVKQESNAEKGSTITIN